MARKKLTDMKEWKALHKHYHKIKCLTLRELFASDRTRAERFTIREQDMYLDYSKNRVTGETMRLLAELAAACGLKYEIERIFKGDRVNETEDRAALHTALRNVNRTPVFFEGKDVMPEVVEVLEKMKALSERVRSGDWKGYTGKPVKNIVNIGIGGSDLGPCMATEALKYYSKRDLSFFFVSNVDESHIMETIRGLDPGETLFIVASKTFTTQETMANAETAKKWIMDSFGSEQAIRLHFVALSTNTAAVKEFGMDAANMLGFWDWVGGRYSLTSAIGLPVMISIGYDGFTSMLSGFNDMDIHFRNEPFDKNIPVVMGLLGVWYNNFFNAETHAIFPYDHYLGRLPAYLEQADMESNGKCSDRSGKRVAYQTGPVIWGGAGTNAQHSFFQLLHQGTRLVPADFIGFAESLWDDRDHRRKLMANLFAQTEALAFGKSEKELEDEGVPAGLIAFRKFEGNRPSNTIMAGRLTPRTLGRLIAMYEHKIFTQGIIWDINSFDQWGVELGKELAKKIVPELDPESGADPDHDSSTNGLIRYYLDRQR